MILTHDNPMGIDVYPTTIGGGIVWLGIGCDFGECDVRVAIMKEPAGGGTPTWTFVPTTVWDGHIKSSDGNVELKVDTDGSTYHRYSVVISNIKNEAVRDFGDGAPRPSKFGEPYCGIVVSARIQPDSKIG